MSTRGRAPRRAVRILLAAALLGAIAAGAIGCLMPRYLSQAAAGQLDLLARARPIDQVIADPAVPLRTRMLLAEIDGIKALGARVGLSTSRNYRRFVEVPASGTVWFVGASRPLAFEPKKWCFPIAGCFTGLGWFDEDDAVAHRDQLRRDGWDAMARPAGAYSTGGWFPDPVVSSMLSPDDHAYAWLANVVLHESVHATIFIPDQPFFNEGLAEYIGDALTDTWLRERFGADSIELVAWTEAQALRTTRVERSFAAYQELEALYKSDRSDADKLREKQGIIDALVADLRLWTRPNNASLVELRVYQASYQGFARVQAACGGDVARVVASARTVTRADFAGDLDENLTPALDKIVRGCQTGSPGR